MLNTYADIIRLLNFKCVETNQNKPNELSNLDPREFKSDLYDITFTKTRNDGNRFDIVKSRDGKYSIFFYENLEQNSINGFEYTTLLMKNKMIFENFKHFLLKINDIFKYELRILKILEINKQ